ncbi:DMSO/TMAO reductase YedYZ heme-binding membrane subunit [Ruminiclostridium sufflavum DSM 19573]|uniref:DMSO/TMAO reductase YedYZ heme-binding membrane subunit n=1 Tax=Ruminiclostridium sufflavum DSM 19573 TaxID=1121337 RepID=A0A318XLX1_9FIRM|nr:ferric reductase-like transmembrane domain-containing protein [Ruminiclostridium sufflavum]PYG88727.1 DMSO/TMAO reductase YedYZ heme-binding membrane subunit [Ruminiclostridium sufflavum DSM 19573]
MLLLLGLVQVFIFIFVFHNALKKYPERFYTVAVCMVIFLIADILLEFSVEWPDWIQTYILSVFQRGSFATSLFIVVMFIGALDKKRPAVRALFKIRAELSIVASILTLGHNLIYGWSYFPMLFTRPGDMRPEYAAASVVTIVLLVLMIPLFITSFSKVRRKMSAHKWKSLQRLAYPFYILIYVHVMILFIPRWNLGGNYVLGILGYTAIYSAYVILRLKKYFNDRKHKQPRYCKTHARKEKIKN